MPDGDKTVGGLDLRIWWRHLHTLYSFHSNGATQRASLKLARLQEKDVFITKWRCSPVETSQFLEKSSNCENVYNLRNSCISCRTAIRSNKAHRNADNCRLDHHHMAARGRSPGGLVHVIPSRQELESVDSHQRYSWANIHEFEGTPALYHLSVSPVCSEWPWDQQAESSGWIHNVPKRFVFH